MRTLVHHLPYTSRSDVFRFYHLTDTHIGARALGFMDEVSKAG